MTVQMNALNVIDHASADGGRRTLEAQAQEVRREARSRFGGLFLDRANPGARFRNRACQPPEFGLFAEAGKLGLVQFALPTQVGGAGRDRFAWGVVLTEITRISADFGFPALLDITVANTELILSTGRPELIDRYVPDLVAGRRFVVQGAYESRDPYDYQTTARYEGGEWILNGAKRFLAGGVFANLYILYVRDEASNDLLAFAVERDDPGVTPVRLETMGLRTMGLGQLLLHDVRLPDWRLLWRSDALSELNTYARNRRTMSACGILGAAEGVVGRCVESLSTRMRGGRRVLDYPNVERSVGEMRVLVEAARSAVYRALDGTRAPGRDPYFDVLATTAKHQVTECALRIGQLVMNLQGAEGYMATLPWEQFMRDVLGAIGGQGSQELLLIQLGQRSIVGLETELLRRDGAERTVAKLADAWWALSALDASERAEASDRPALARVVGEVLTVAGLTVAADGAARGELAALLDRAHALLAAVGSGDAPDALPRGPAGAFDGPLADLAAKAWAFLACAVAVRTGLLAQLVAPGTVREAAGRAGVGEPVAGEILDILVKAQVVRVCEDGRYLADPGLERLLMGGPRTSAFAARLRRTVAGSAVLRAGDLAGRPGDGSGPDLAGRGADAQVLADVLVNTLLGRLEGLDELLDSPGLRIGCAAGDGGQSAVALAQQIPITSVLALEPDRNAAEHALAARPPGGGPVQVRAGEVTGLRASDRLALAWLPTAGLPAVELNQAICAAATAIVPGGWLVLPCPLAPGRALGAAVARLQVTLCGAPLADGEVEQLLRQAGLGHTRAIWDDATLGVRLVAARRPR